MLGERTEAALEAVPPIPTSFVLCRVWFYAQVNSAAVTNLPKSAAHWVSSRITLGTMTLSSVERFYCGKLSGEVTVREAGLTRTLESRLNSSAAEPKSFTWGRDETGATQLALALLADALRDDADARRLHQNFRHRVIANLPDRWTITRTRILAYVRMMKYQSSGQSAIGQIAVGEQD